MSHGAAERGAAISTARIASVAKTRTYHGAKTPLDLIHISLYSAHIIYERIASVARTRTSECSGSAASRAISGSSEVETLKKCRGSVEEVSRKCLGSVGVVGAGGLEEGALNPLDIYNIFVCVCVEALKKARSIRSSGFSVLGVMRSNAWARGEEVTW